CIKNTIYIKNKIGYSTTSVLYFALSNPGVFPKRGAAQPFISQGDARRIVLKLPPLETQERFDHVVTPLLFQIQTLHMSNGILQQSRDLLLPRLISGELPIAAAEREIEKAA